MKSFLYCYTFFFMLRLLHIKDAACREKSLLSALIFRLTDLQNNRRTNKSLLYQCHNANEVLNFA